MAARQQHGFDFEYLSIEKFGWTPVSRENNPHWYTSRFDAFCPRFELPVSVKTAKERSLIELGDFRRQSNQKTDFLMCVGIWSGKTKEVHTEYLLHIPADYWIAQFENSPVDAMLDAFEGITNSYEDDQKWTTRRKELTALWNKSSSDLNINFKRDHKNQRRVQCSISWNTFKDKLIPKYSVKYVE